jgi:hypothetical protein
MGVDKILHFFCSFIIAVFDPTISFIIGVGKECGDAIFGGVADIYDLIADWAGIIFEVIIKALLS